MGPSSCYLVVAVASVVVLVLLLLPPSLGFISEEALQGERGGAAAGEDDPVIRMALQGGIVDVEGVENCAEAEELARFAVEEHNKKENVLLQFSRLVKAKEQVVSGIMHHLTVEVIEGGKKKLYEAKVWVQAWLNSKKLHEFNPIGNSSSITPADVGVKWEKIVALMAETEATETSLDQSAVVSQVLGTRSGYIKGMGHGEPPILSSKRGRCLNCSSSQQFVDVICELEDIKNELSKTKEELTNTKEELANVKGQYTFVSSELQQIRALLVSLGSRSSISLSPPSSST